MKGTWLLVLAVGLLPASVALSAEPGYAGTTSEGRGTARATVDGGRIVLELGYSERCSSSLTSRFGVFTTGRGGGIRPHRDGTFAYRETGTRSIGGEMESYRIAVSGRRAGDVISGSFTTTSSQGGVTCASGAIRYRLTKR